MTMNKTTNYGFPKPALGDSGSTLLSEYNTDLDTADDNLKTALDAKAPVDNPTFTGTVAATTFSGNATLNPSPNDHAWSGCTVTGTAGENLAIGDVAYLKAADGKYWKAKGDAASTMPACVLATAAISADASGTFLKGGYFRDDSWSAWTVGGQLYVSAATGGAMTQTAPATTGNQLQNVGYAHAAKVVYFDPIRLVGTVA